MQIYFQLATVKKGNTSITEYFQTIKTLSDTLAAAGQPLNDFESVSFLLKGLGSEYDPFVTSVTTRVDPLSIDELYGLLLAHEMRLEQQVPTLDIQQPVANLSSRAPMARGRGSRGRGSRPYHRGGRGSFNNNRGRGSYFSQDAASSSRPTCQICGKLGHTALRCYQRQESSSFSDSPQPSPQAYYSSPMLPAEDTWYPDTGATHHITNDLQNLNLSHEEYTGQDQIRVGDGTGLPISHTGSASLSLSRRSCLLNQLLRVPQICKNLLSVRQFAADNSVFFEFHSFHFVIKDSQTGTILHQGLIKDGLYQLTPSSSSPPIKQVFLGERTSTAHWHKRLGHPAFRTVHRVLSQFQLLVLSNKAASSCIACPQAKGHQLPFVISNSRICKPLDLIYFDVWGPSPTLSFNGNRYYVSFIDAFSRYTWVFAIQSKSDVMSTFLQFQIMIERLLNSKIKSVQSDWGGEYRNLHTYFQSIGISHRISCPHTHQ
jgi:hypothetical protein